MRAYEDLKIAVAGTGYVGMSIATLLAQHHEVIAVDVVPEKVEKINQRISPIQDEYIERYLAEKPLRLTATLDAEAAYKEADIVVIAAPTNYDPVKNFFDTHHIEDVINLVIKVNPDALMVIKSTIPVGYTRSLYVKYALKFLTDPALKGKKFNLLFSPEFLRESKALYDNLYPSRRRGEAMGRRERRHQRHWQSASGGASENIRPPVVRRGYRPCGGGCHRSRRREGNPCALDGHEGGGGCEVVRQHLFGIACQLLQ